MKELQQKQKLKRKLYSTPALIALLVITIFAIRGAYGVVVKDRESQRYVDNLKAKITLLSARESELKVQIARLGTDEGIDTLIKEKFSVSKEGEKVAVILDRDDKSTSTSQVELNWLQKLWRGFLDLW